MDKEPLDFITNFERELRDIAEKTKAVNPTLYESARKSKEAKKNSGNVIGAFYALYLQEYELRVVESIIRWLITETKVMHHPAAGRYVGAYELMVLNCSRPMSMLILVVKALEAAIICKTKELTGFDLIWRRKIWTRNMIFLKSWKR